MLAHLEGNRLSDMVQSDFFAVRLQQTPGHPEVNVQQPQPLVNRFQFKDDCTGCLVEAPGCGWILNVGG